MSWQPTAYSLVAFGAAGVSAAVLLFAWRYRSEPAGEAFFGLMLALGGWAFAYGVQLGFETFGSQLLVQRVALAVGGLVPTLWLLFTLQYTGFDDWLTRRRLALLAIDPVAFAALALTNPAHGLLWSGATFLPAAAPAVVLSLGPGYYVHIAYAYLVVATGLGLLVRSFLRSNLYRTQTGLLILGALPPFVANVAFTLRLDWATLPALDLTPIAFTLTGALFGAALFRFDLLERVPVARERLLAETDDGFAILDDDGRIVRLNPIARRLLDPATSGDRSLRERLHGDLPDGDLEALDGETLTATVGARRRTYDLDCSPLTDRHGRTVGHVVTFRDITDRHAYEQRLEVAHRLLRHNLRNRMTVIRGWADRLAERGDGEDARAARRIVATADELIDLSDKARTMATTAAGPDVTPEPVDVSEHVAALVDEFRADHPDVAVESTVPPDVRAALPDPELLSIALGNLLENAVEHNDAAAPRVRVSVEPPGPGDSRVRVRVADNGPGIPEAERTVLREGTETPLQHGSGLGLWLAHWSITTAGGEISFDTTGDGGSVVTLSLRAPDGAT